MSVEEHNDRDLARLLELAGPRPEPDERTTADVYAAVRSRWQQRTRRSRLRTWALQGVAAAAVLAAVFVAMRPGTDTPLAPPAALGSVVAGAVQQFDNGSWVRLGSDTSVRATLRLRSDDGAAVQLATGIVRIGADTRLRFATATRIELDEGRIYIDTAGSDRQIEVITAAGVVRNLGTRFEVRADERGVRVRVRAGEVVLRTTTQTQRATAGEALQTGSNGTIARSRFAPTDPDWRWITPLAPVFATDGARVIDLIDWVARETGRDVSFADAVTRNAAAATRLSGSLDGLSPDELLATALSATRFDVQLDETAIVISRRP